MTDLMTTTVAVPTPTYAMADSINASDLRNLPARIVAFAGYDNGHWPDYQAIAAEHPGAYLLDFTVFLAAGTGGDFEPGDMSPADAVPYYNDAKAAGVARPVFYSSIDTYMEEIWANLTAAGIPRSGVRLLAAHYRWGLHICGPTTCNLGGGIQCDGTQWTDHADDGSGLGNWDESVLAADFFAAHPQPAPSPTPTEDPMAGVSRTITTPDGYRRRASIMLGGLCAHWLDQSGKWQTENVAAKSDPNPHGPVHNLTFTQDQVPTIDWIPTPTQADPKKGILTVGAQQTASGFSFEFDQDSGTPDWGATQVSGLADQELVRIPQRAAA